MRKRNLQFKATVQELFHQFEQGRWYGEARSYLKDKNKMHNLLGLVSHLLHNRALAPVVKDLILLYYYVKDVVGGRYKLYNVYKLVLIVAVLIYVVTPLDFVPDWLPAVGFLDDAALISFVVKMADRELERYFLWVKQQRGTSQNSSLQEPQR